MELLWGSLLLVAACVSAVQGWPEDDVKEDPDIDMPQPLHIVEEGNLKVLTPAGLTQMLNQTRFLMVLFCECPLLGGGQGWVRPVPLLLEDRGVFSMLNIGEHILIF